MLLIQLLLSNCDSLILLSFLAFRLETHYFGSLSYAVLPYLRQFTIVYIVCVYIYILFYIMYYA